MSKPLGQELAKRDEHGWLRVVSGAYLTWLPEEFARLNVEEPK